VVEYTRLATNAPPLPDKIEVYTRTYEVLGYYRQQSGKKVTVHKDKVVLKNMKTEDIIITNWPMNIRFGHYKEIYG
jgi:hypothetical protein